MWRSIVLSLAVAAVCLAADQAEARGRRGRCSGGSCGVSSGGCYGGSYGATTSACQNGQCRAPAPAPPVVTKADTPAPAPAVAKEAAPARQPVVQNDYSNGTRRYARWRSGGRRFR